MSGVTCHVSRVTCHMSRVTCHMSPVTCHISCVRFFLNLFIYFFWVQSGEASQGRVCYQRGLPHLVFINHVKYRSLDNNVHVNVRTLNINRLYSLRTITGGVHLEDIINLSMLTI